MHSFNYNYNVKLTTTVLIPILAVALVRFLPEPPRTRVSPGSSFNFDPEGKLVGRVIENSSSRYVIEKRLSPACGAGFRSACSPPLHLHLDQVETFDVISGTFHATVDGLETTLMAGQSVVIQPGSKHTFCRGGDNELVVHITLEPPFGERSRNFFNTFSGIMRDSNLKPGPVQLMYMFCNSGMRLADIPLYAHDVLCKAADVLAPVMGYHLAYPDVYSG